MFGLPPPVEGRAALEVHGVSPVTAARLDVASWPSSFWPRAARPGKLVLEGRFDDAVQRELVARGHLVSKGEDWSEGRLSGARIEPDGQMFAGNLKK